MSKNRVKLDRKTRRAIEHAIKANNARTKASVSVNSSGFITGMNIGAYGTGPSKASSGSSSTTLPPIEGALYVTPFTFYECEHHIKVAQALWDFDYTIVCRRAKDTERSVSQIAFYSEEERASFVKWLTKYLAKFGDCADFPLPPPLDGNYPYRVRSQFSKTHTVGNATMSITIDGSSEWETTRFEQWVWILANCSDEVRHTGHFWFFADQGDATLFKMAFPS